MNDNTPRGDDLFEIGADSIDTGEIVRRIKERVEQRKRDGFYTDARVARAERMNLMNLKGDRDFQQFFLECLRDAVFVDISDYEIVERRARLARALKSLKKTIWKLLKFYTYRLWSQQNQVNGFLLAAVEGTDRSLRERIDALEKRISALENSSRE
jgi:hypothetical protein